MKLDNVNQIKFHCTLEGSGIVNMNGSSKETRVNPYGRVTKGNSNNTLGKANLYLKDGAPDDGDSSNYIRKIKISSNLIRKLIWEKDQPIANAATIKPSDEDYTKSIATLVGITRGYMDTDKARHGLETEDGDLVNNNDNIVKRTSPVLVTDAEVTSSASPYMELHSSSGVRSDTSYFYKENQGAVEYEFDIVIDLDELQFVSADFSMGRRAIPIDKERLFLDTVSENLGIDDAGDIGTYILATDSTKTQEYGVLLSENAVTKIVDGLVDRIKNIQVFRPSSGAWAKISKISYSTYGKETVFDRDDNMKELQKNTKFSDVCPFVHKSAYEKTSESYEEYCNRAERYNAEEAAYKENKAKKKGKNNKSKTDEQK